MNLLPRAVTKVIESFERLPGIGQKTAQRLSFYLLHVPQEELDAFASSVRGLKANTVLCSVCKNVTESDPCPVCSSPTRDKSVLCVVEQPTDVLALEKTGAYEGVYHVLHGAIDPLNNIGPDEIYVHDLVKRISSPGSEVKEVIFALNATMEGEATCMYIQKQLKGVKITRLASGLPIGSDIEYADEVTLKRAMDGRREY